ncbi:MAG: cyclic pyranopterin monophosphate synthase MoaC [Gammaproteobacteria bacterium]
MISHIGSDNRPKMVDVSKKSVTRRTAHARSVVRFPPELVAVDDSGEIQSKKGPVFQTAIIAGVMAAKKTHELVPFCHPLRLEDCQINIVLNNEATAVIDCRVTALDKTGVEMEALTGASIAALTVYDMCKSLSHDLVISETRLIEKRGGKSDYGVK